MAAATTGGFSVTGLIQNVDTLGHTYVQTTYQALARSIGGVGVGGTLLTLLLTLYVVFWGISIWAGTARGTPIEITYRLFRVFVIVALALTWAEFQTLVYNFFNDAPDAIGKAMLNVSQSGLNSPDGVQSGLQNIVDVTNTAAEKFVKNAGVLSWGIYFYSMIYQIIMYVFVALAIAAIIMTKIMTWILLALGPIFILLMLFTVTARYTMGWINALVLFFVIQIIVYAFLAFYLSLVTGIMTALSQKAGLVKVAWGDMVPAMLMGVIGSFLLIQIPAVAGMIVGASGFHWTALGSFLRFSGLRRAPPRDPGRAPQASLGPSALGPSGPGLIGQRPDAPLLSPPARQLAPPMLQLMSPAHYSAEAQRLAKQLKNNT